MKKIILKLININNSDYLTNWTLLFFRVAVSFELIYAHGLKKLGVGTAASEVVPNPLHLPEAFNQAFATLANIGFPFFIIFGLFTRLCTIPVLAVTLTGYFIVHLHDTPLVRDTPYMYSISFLLILFLGPGRYSLDNLISKKINHLNAK